SGIARSRCGIRICAVNGRKFVRAQNETSRSCCNTRSITSTESWPSIALQICARCARARNSRRGIARRALMPLLGVQVSELMFRRPTDGSNGADEENPGGRAEESHSTCDYEDPEKFTGL